MPLKSTKRSPSRVAKPPAAGLRATSKATSVAAQRAASSLRGAFVYEALRNEIRTGRMRPGDRLRELEIAARLGVSRTPVREALKRLDADGLLAFTQPRGLTVAELSHSQMLELYAIREVLAGAAARLAAKHAAPYEILALQQMVVSHQDIVSAQQAAEANRQLHAAIVAATHNEYLRRCTTVLSDALALLGPTTYSVPGRIQSGWEENARIVDAIARHDDEAAEAAARQHIRAACAVRLAMNRERLHLESRE